MKKLVSLLLVAVMLMSVMPMTAFARNAYIAYGPVEGCQLLDISFTQADNPWLLWDVTFEEVSGATVLETTKDHPSLVGCEVVPTIDFEGKTMTFNGKTIAQGDKIVLKAENELVISDSMNHNLAEYTLRVTEKSNGMPSVLIDTDGAPIPDKLNYVDASISVIGSEIYGGKNFYSAVSGIKLRGNSTMGYDKKPYRIKFDKKQDVLGLGKAKSWVLLADYLDPSSLRNQVAFAMAARVNENTSKTTGFQVFAPRMKLVEVYLNGEYQGLYEMGDHMQANEIRVAINEDGDELDDNDVQLFPEGNVGYFIEVEVESRVLAEGKEGYEDWSAYSYIENVGASSSAQDDKLYFQFKLPEVPSDEQIDFITDYMQNVNNLIMANNDDVWNYLDMDSVIDWYLVNELFKNVDSQMQSSIYLFKDKDVDGKTSKLFMGPVWDFDLGAGGVTYGDMDDPTSWRTRNDEYCGWLRELFEMDSFKNAVNARWADLHEAGILDAVFADIDTLSVTAEAAAKDNYDLWHDNYLDETEGSWMTVPEVSSYADNWEAQVDYFRAFMNARISWMDEQFDYAPQNTFATVTEDAHLFENEVYTATASGTVSQTYAVNELIDLDKLLFDLDITTTAPFNFGFNFTVALTSAAGGSTFTLTPSAKDDWQSGSNVFEGTTGQYIAAGTYNDRVMGVTGALTWNLWANYRSQMQAMGFTKQSEIDLTKVIKNIRLNSVTVTLNPAVAGSKATFTLQNVDADGNPLQVTKTIIEGKPSIMGDPTVGNTLFVSKTEILPYDASVAYQWYANGSAINGATDSRYTLKAEDLGKEITVKAHGTFLYSGTVTSDVKTVVKPMRTTEAATPVLDSVTADSLTVVARDGFEYSLDGENWQATGTFTGLTANTVYTVYERAAEHDTKTAGAVSDALIIVTDAYGTIKGDVNGSGKLDTVDATWVLEQGLKFADMKNETMLNLADFNDDGRINTLDARLILKQLVNSL